MQTENGGAAPGLMQALENILRHYKEPYFVRRDLTIGGMPVAALAEVQVREEKKLFGIPAAGLKLGESVAGEFLLFVLEDVFTVEVAQRVVALAESAKQELIHSHDNYSYIFFSVAALVSAVEPDAVKALKKVRTSGGYSTGWIMTRLTAVCPAEGRAWYNSDGKELGKLLLNRMKA